MATPARHLATPSAAPELVGVPAPADAPDHSWSAGEWVEVERVRLAPVIALDDYRDGGADGASTPVSRRRLTMLLGALGVALLLALTAGGRLADAGPTDRVAGEAVVDPGETLWDVAVANAPSGVDPRTYLAEIRDLNGFASATVPAWTVVLLPAH